MIMSAVVSDDSVTVNKRRTWWGSSANPPQIQLTQKLAFTCSPTSALAIALIDPDSNFFDSKPSVFMFWFNRFNRAGGGSSGSAGIVFLWMMRKA